MSAPDVVMSPERSTSGPQGLVRGRVLTIIGGSSSLKFAVFAADGVPARVGSSRIEHIGRAGSRLILRD